jgi:hypothetical protein
MNRDPAAHFARMEYERQIAQAQGGSSGGGLDAAGPPSWDRAAWENHKAQYGEYPFSAHHLPPTFEGALDWVYQLMGLRKPPVSVRMGSAGAAASPADRASVWGIK